MTYAADERVEAYIAALPHWQQAICRQVRDLAVGVGGHPVVEGGPGQHPGDESIEWHTLHDMTLAWSAAPVNRQALSGVCSSGVNVSQPSRLSLRQPPARLLAMMCLNMALRAAALMASPRRMATVRAVLLS